jgi:hypothetical protein
VDIDMDASKWLRVHHPEADVERAGIVQTVHIGLDPGLSELLLSFKSLKNGRSAKCTDWFGEIAEGRFPRQIELRGLAARENRKEYGALENVVEAAPTLFVKEEEEVLE